jgi:hypothetical protein
VKVSEQVATAPLPLRVHAPPLLNVPPDGGLWVKVTVPVGVIGVLGEVSVTVAVQVDGELTKSGDGEQETDVVVSRRFVTVCPSKGMVWEWT